MREIIKLGLILLVITSIAGLVLGFVNSLTSPIIEDRLIAESREAMEAFFPDLDDVEVVDEGLLSDFHLAEEAFEVLKGDDVIGYSIKTTPNGYGGEIQLLTGISIDGEIVGIEIISQTETAGLGDVIETDDFKDRFVGQPADENMDVDVISGATVSTRAVIDGVKASIEVFLESLTN